jgi:deoxyribodipyrimidine photo-lyase
LQVVWFKRDLRIGDHAPLAEAAARGPVLPLYIVEPPLLQAPDHHVTHWEFTRQALVALRDALAQLGQPLVVRVGDPVDVLRDLPVAALWAHEETTNWLAYQRDRAVRRWARQAGVPFTELPQTGVIRRLNTRDGWSKKWEQRMHLPLVEPPRQLTPVNLDPGPIPSARDLHLGDPSPYDLPRGGTRAALDTLDSFLQRRGRAYRGGISSPNTAPEACSRLSPYLATGALSMRQIVQATRRRLENETDSAWRRSLQAFVGRLHWHCHFMQKLEDEPRLEFENAVRTFDGLRENNFNREYFDRWCSGHTGFPLVDACMRCLHHTRWINFRMRAMLISFAAHHLWLHWREPALHLARLFLDYEPGIHYSQIQMQAGTTGINTLRIYSPAKQQLDHDPDELFIRRWLPEYGTAAYPAPLVNHEQAVAAAKAQWAAARRRPETRAEAKRVLAKHGSRRSPAPRKPRPKRQPPAEQTSLF